MGLDEKSTLTPAKSNEAVHPRFKVVKHELSRGTDKCPCAGDKEQTAHCLSSFLIRTPLSALAVHLVYGSMSCDSLSEPMLFPWQPITPTVEITSGAKAMNIHVDMCEEWVFQRDSAATEPAIGLLFRVSRVSKSSLHGRAFGLRVTQKVNSADAGLSDNQGWMGGGGGGGRGISSVC